MHRARFRDPAGSIREGTYDPESGTVEVEIEGVGTLEHGVRIP